jgi:drug/metabolite transporter (DMT)-like permease
MFSFSKSSRLTPRVILAFFIIYFVWGSTYLAIRIAVATVPPLFAAGLRFSLAGLALLIWSKLRGVTMPTGVEWRNLAIEAALMFLCGYSALFWAETRIPSGVVSVLVATTPICMALVEIFVFKRGHLRLPLLIALCLGFAGVSLLALQHGVEAMPLLPCLAILGAQFAWCIGTMLSKTLAAPASKILTAGAQMALGGLMLLLCSLLAGEMSPWPSLSSEAAGAILYMIVAGSLLAFTAYMWLLARMPATLVASYAYVNPVVALALGYSLGHEVLGRNILAGTAMVLVSVVLILRTSSAGH